MSTDYCSQVTTSEDRQECQIAIDYITAVFDYNCAHDEPGEFCDSYNQSHLFSTRFDRLPRRIRRDLAEIFVNTFGFERSSDVGAAYDSLVALEGLPPHSIVATEPMEFDREGEEAEVESNPPYRPAGWGTLVDVSIDGLAFRESDGSDARAGTRLSAAYYFDLGFFASGGFEFITTFAEDAGVFNFDLALEGGYYLPILNHFGFEFFVSLNLGYLMSDGSVADDGARSGEISSFDAGVGGGVRAMIPLVDEPVKSNIPSLFIGAEYSRRLNCDLLPPDQLFLSTGFLFDYV